MKRITRLISAVAVAVVLVSGCAQTPQSATQPSPQPEDSSMATEQTPSTADSSNAITGGGFELALVTDLGTIDDRSFNQGAWEGLERYALEFGITHEYFTPLGQGDDFYLTSIALAVEGGAQLIVTPGFLFEPAIYDAQTLFPDVKFILLDGVPRDAATGDSFVAPNTVSILYSEDQSGFLAGYATVMDGHRSLGFLGGLPVPAVVRFGIGFLQGAEHAAVELGLEPGDVSVRYSYLNGFAPAPEHQALASSWFNDGIEVIFAAAGGAGASVMAAAEAQNGLTIGVDIDQSYDSPTVITSAVKELGNSVYNMIESFYAGTFPGGQTQTLGADRQGVGLPVENSRFATFSQADYNRIFDQVATGAVVVNDDIEMPISGFGLSLVSVTEVK